MYKIIIRRMTRLDEMRYKDQEPTQASINLLDFKQSVNSMAFTAPQISSSSSLTLPLLNPKNLSKFNLLSLFPLSLSTLRITHTPLKLETTTCRAIQDGVVFDDAAYEAERLSLDAKARDSMAEQASNENDDDPKAWKWVIRNRVWDLMEAQNIAQFPRPVHHRIPNFVAANLAARKVIS